MSAARFLTTLLGGVLAVLMAGAAPRAQEEVDLGEVARAEAEAIEEARLAFEAADYPQTVLLIDRLLAGGDPAAGAAPLSGDAHLEAEALRMRAIAYFNLARPDDARQDFRALLRLDAGHELDARLTSPKVIALFDEVRAEMTGVLKVDSAPPGAEVVIAGRRMGAAPIPGVRLLAGTYAVEVTKPGYEAASGSLEVRAGQVEIHTVSLTRNSRVLAIITAPAGARVLVDGKEAGTTSGLAPASAVAALESRGIPPESASAPLLVPGVRRGTHVVRVEKSCHEPFEAAVSVENLEGDLPMEIDPIVLRESIGTLVLESNPSGAEVTLDGAPRGRTPLRLEGMCAGTVSIEMRRQGTGVWTGMVGVAAGEETRISGALRLTLASAGAVREPGVPDEVADVWDRFLADVLERQHTYHAIPLASGPDIGPARIELYRRIQGDAAGAPALEPSSRAALAAEIGGDLVLVAVPGRDRSGELMLYFRDLARPDRIAVSTPDAGTARSIAERLSRPTSLTAAWSGLRIVDGGEGGFPLIVDLAAGAGPAEGGVRAGDRILAIEGRPVTTRREVEERFAGRAPGEKIPVLVGRNAARENVVVTARETPLLPHPGNHEALASKMLADLSALRLSTEDGDLRSFASLAVGTILLLRDEPRRAIEEGFASARLPPRRGVSPATVDYLIGLAYERLGGDADREQAREAFRRAAQDRQATLWRDDGPPVAAFAEARGNRP